MARRKKYVGNDPFERQDSMVTEAGKTVTRGDIIKIQGIWGTKFKFVEFVTNPKNGAIWIDCIELERGVQCGMRSFRPNRVRTIPKKRGKRVRRTGSSQAS